MNDHDTIYDNYLNGNLTDFYKTIRRMNKYEFLNFILCYSADKLMIDRLNKHLYDK